MSGLQIGGAFTERKCKAHLAIIVVTEHNNHRRSLGGTVQGTSQCCHLCAAEFGILVQVNGKDKHLVVFADILFHLVKCLVLLLIAESAVGDRAHEITLMYLAADFQHRLCWLLHKVGDSHLFFCDKVGGDAKIVK